MQGITILQTALAILMIVAVLLQQRGSGVGGAFGGGQDTSFSTRRGPEKVIYQATIILAILFFGVSIIRLLI